ncbi:exocyst complex component EXO70C1-like [Lycium ferocissimum]|uniref:exocyst complex component EXO70C1-like n=1 Tax=Lycium ferocissimum TaxID=112874 RepID=UPI0028169501|nr:exocyst complex component EXO70C1-like [Lycium ferocissimum]
MESNIQSGSPTSPHAKNINDKVCEDMDNSNPSELPENIENFSKIIESRIAKCNSGETPTRSGKITEEESFFLEAVMHLSKLTNAIDKSPSGSTLLSRTNAVLQKAMTFMEEELRTLLEDFGSHSNSKVNKNSQVDEDYPSYPLDVVTRMNRIATAMISAGFETACCQVYSISRRNAFYEQMKMLEFEKINVDDVQRMSWDSLEGEITRWINVAKSCSNTLFPGERRLGESVFSDSPIISQSLFNNLARSIVIQILDFAEAVSRTKHTAEKLFKYLDIYDTIRDLINAISESLSINDTEHQLKSEILATRDRFGEAAVNIFCDLENSIKNDVARTPVPGGAVHPVTRYVMNYLKCACEYKDALEHIFKEHAKLEAYSTKSKSSVDDQVDNKESESPHDNVAVTTPLTAQLMTIMDLLDVNLKAKSNLYRDPSLRDIFLMNNGRYILQKAKGSTEVRQVMGDTWCRRRSTTVRQYHKNYQRETWGRVLQILSHDGMQVNGKVTKPIVKERFKNFSTMLDDIHRTQSTWVVSDEQLRSELRVSISAVLIPAYRSFCGRFRQYLDNTKHADKYIKYQPEDIETLVEGLFDGNPTSMARRKT